MYVTSPGSTYQFAAVPAADATLPVHAAFRGYGSSPDGIGTPEGASAPATKIPTWAFVVGGVAIVGLIGFAIYANMKVKQRVVEQGGVGGLLALEAGETGLGMLSRATRNGRRRRRRRRH
jgi:hypothetical protein